MEWLQRTQIIRIGALVGISAMLAAPVLPAQTSGETAQGAVLVFDGVSVVDVEQGKVILDQRVVVVGNRIQVIGSNSEVKMPDQAHVIAARDKFLIPGLWDLHTHPGDTGRRSTQDELFIANGITGIRDAGSPVPIVTRIQWRNEILAGTRVGPPRQLLSGPRLNEIDESPKSCATGWDGCIRPRRVAAARALVRSIWAEGADMIKTYDLSDSMYVAVVTEARRLGMWAGGHAGALPVTVASDSGAGLIDHATLNVQFANDCFFATASIEQCRPVAERLARNNTWWVPTWVMPPHGTGERSAAIYHGFETYLHRFWTGSVEYESLRDYLRGTISDTSAGPFEHDLFEALARRPRPTGDMIPDSAGYMYVVRNAGLPLVAGTDAVGSPDYRYVNPPGFSLHAELATYVAEGLTPREALQAATLNPAKFLRATDSLGTVAPGKLADLVLLDANPLADITNTTLIRAVVANGRYYDRAELDGLLVRARARTDDQKPKGP